MDTTAPRRPRPLRRLLAAVLGTLVALLVAELALRVAFPGSVFLRGAEVRAWEADDAERDLYRSDARLGYVPVPDGPMYAAHGAVRNAYTLEKRLGVQRLLFLGDSVTARGRITRELRALLGEEVYEYWNAGVEGYNTVQEVEYFRRLDPAIDPDHVVLTFHNNDFHVTPVTFVDERDRLVVYAPKVSLEGFDPWLFGRSHLVRFLTARLLAGDGDGGDLQLEMRERTRESLAELAALLATSR